MSIVKVDKEKCIGCGACVAIAPDNFDFDDEGISTVINEEVTDATKDAEEACPVLAIDIVEGEPKKVDRTHKDIECDDDECDEDDNECCCDECDYMLCCIDEDWNVSDYVDLDALDGKPDCKSCTDNECPRKE